MKTAVTTLAAIIFFAALIVSVSISARAGDAPRTEARPPVAAPFDSVINDHAAQMLADGRKIFRSDTFGSEAFWGDTLLLHRAILGEKAGGVGPGLSPKAALGLGLKVDMDVLPADLVAKVKAGQVNLDDPATTDALLRLDAVVGVRGFYQGAALQKVGITCALCHSTVDDAFSPGIGHRLDGWPNRDLDVGSIVLLAPNVKFIADLLGVDVPTASKVLKAWGPGRYDAELNLDGKGFRPDGKTAATLIPPAFGTAGINEHTWTTGWGNTAYWNAFVANLQMQGQGTFFDPRLADATKYPVAARAKFNDRRSPRDQITSKLAPLHFYQLAIPAPKPPPGTFDAGAAAKGKSLFEGTARCATCHVPPLFTEPGSNSHTGAEIGIDEFQASRSPTGRYRTAPLRGLFAHSKGGFYHDGRFSTLLDVVNHYDTFFKLGLDTMQKTQLVEYLKSL